MKAVISIDTLYLSVKYPRSDAFKTWFKFAEYTDYRKLREGIAVGDFVVRTGAAGYKVSVWQHDARVYLTDETDEKRGEGNGMGVWVQLGPKFILQHINELHKAVNDLLDAVGVSGSYPVRITRLDVAIDLLGASMMDQDINLWEAGWVGRSKVSGIFNNSRTGQLETLYVGSRKSPVFLRVYDKVAQSIVDGDLIYWQDVWKGFDGPVIRIEWEIKPNDGNFQQDLIDFSLFNGFSIRELLVYLLDWGRLCIPNPTDTNRKRWDDSPFWAELRNLVAIWADGVNWPTSRYGKEFHGVSDAYIKFVVGTVSGAIARLNDEDFTIWGLVSGLESHGEKVEAISRKAAAKAAIYSKL
jgi:hypothetical protein